MLAGVVVQEQDVLLAQGLLHGRSVGLELVDTVHDGLLHLFQSLHVLGQALVPPAQDRLLLRVYLGTQVLECLLDLPLGDVVLLVQTAHLLLHFASADEQAFYIVFQSLNAALDLVLDDGLGLADGLDVVVLVLAMDDALGADALALAVEAEVQDLFLVVLRAGLLA